MEAGGVAEVLGGAAGTNYHTDFNQPDSESKSVQDALKNVPGVTLEVRQVFRNGVKWVANKK